MKTVLKPCRIHIDTETGGQTSGSVIFQIGAWCNLTEQTLDIKVSSESCRDLGLHFDKATLNWWEFQSPELFARVSSGTVPLPKALAALSTWLTSQVSLLAEETPVEIWMNSPSFDSEKILLPAYMKVTGGTDGRPWDFREERDFRTLVALASELGLPIYRKPIGAHDALVDATTQGKYVEHIFEILYAEMKGV